MATFTSVSQRFFTFFYQNKALLFIIGVIAMVIYSYYSISTTYSSFINTMNNTATHIQSDQKALIFYNAAPGLCQGWRLALAAHYPILASSLGYNNKATGEFAIFASKLHGARAPDVVRMVEVTEFNPNISFEDALQSAGLEPKVQNSTFDVPPQKSFLDQINQYMPLAFLGIMLMQGLP